MTLSRPSDKGHNNSSFALVLETNNVGQLLLTFSFHPINLLGNRTSALNNENQKHELNLDSTTSYEVVIQKIYK